MIRIRKKRGESFSRANTSPCVLGTGMHLDFFNYNILRILVPLMGNKD